MIISNQKQFIVLVYERKGGFCSEIVDKVSYETLLFLDGFEIKGFNDYMTGYLIANQGD